MIIRSQDGKEIVNWDNVTKLYIADDGKVWAGLAAQKSYQIVGIYQNDQKAAIALGHFYKAVIDGEIAFDFPPDYEMPETNTQHGLKINGMPRVK